MNAVHAWCEQKCDSVCAPLQVEAERSSGGKESRPSRGLPHDKERGDRPISATCPTRQPIEITSSPAWKRNPVEAPDQDQRGVGDESAREKVLGGI